MTEGDDFDTRLKSFVDYDEENEAATGTEAGDGSVTEAPEFEKAEDTVSHEPADGEIEPAKKESDGTLTSGVFEAIQEEEEKAASEDYQSLLESFSGEEPEDETLKKIPEESETESVDSSILDTIAPKTTATEEHVSTDEIPEQAVIDEAVESGEEPQSDFSGEEIVESHEDEAEETAQKEDAEPPDESIPGEEADGESQPDALSEDTVIIEPVETVEETVTETADDVLPEDLPAFDGIEIAEEIAGMGIDDAVTDDEAVLQIDEESEYDPAQFKAEPAAEEDDEPVLSSQERAELLGLKEEQQEAVGEISEMTEIIQESVDEEVDELPVDISEEQAAGESAVDETISPIDDLYSQLNEDEEISEEPEPAADVSEPVPAEEVTKGIDNSHILANIVIVKEETTMYIEEVFDKETVI